MVFSLIFFSAFLWLNNKNYMYNNLGLICITPDKVLFSTKKY